MKQKQLHSAHDSRLLMCDLSYSDATRTLCQTWDSRMVNVSRKSQPSNQIKLRSQASNFQLHFGHRGFHLQTSLRTQRFPTLLCTSFCSSSSVCGHFKLQRKGFRLHFVQLWQVYVAGPCSDATHTGFQLSTSLQTTLPCALGRTRTTQAH